MQTGGVPLRVGVSACLLGDRVRWNGAHKHAVDLVAALGPDVEWVRFCPEVEIGLGVPREPIELVAPAYGAAPRLVGVKSGRDLTEKMTSHARARSATLAAEKLDGCILKSGSPSCGMLVPVVGKPVAGSPGAPLAAPGLFAEHLVPALFDVPVLEEVRVGAREDVLHFVERMLAGRRLRRLLDGGPSGSDLARFVERHELQLASHSARARFDLETLVAGMNEAGAAPARRLRFGFARALLVRPTRERRVGALRRAWNRVAFEPGAMKADGAFSPAHRADRPGLAAAIDAFASGAAPFSAPRDLLRAAAQERGDELLLAQTFLDPEPLERRLQETA